jgi:hypothetical protein
MEHNTDDVTVLLKVNDKPLAEEIQRVLANSGVNTMLESDNPMSSALSMYVGSHVFETISVLVAQDSYLEAVKLLEDTPYFELLASDDEEDDNFDGL